MSVYPKDHPSARHSDFDWSNITEVGDFLTSLLLT